MKQYWSIVVGFLLLMGGVNQGLAQNASSILEKCVQTYESSNGIRAHFTLHTSLPQQRTGESFEGTIQMKGDKFKLETPDMTTWYNGKTQWSYVERNEEVNVTTPDGEELQYTNPAVILRLYKKGFKAAYKGTSTTRQAKAAYDITLTPSGKSNIREVTLQVEKQTSVPASITLSDKKGATYRIEISQWKSDANLSDSLFSFPEKEYPNAEIIDLR